MLSFQHAINIKMFTLLVFYLSFQVRYVFYVSSASIWTGHVSSAQQSLAVSGNRNGQCSLRDFGFIIRKALIIQTANAAQYQKNKQPKQKMGRRPK